MKLFNRKKKKKAKVNVIQPKRKPVRDSKFRIFHARTKRRQRAVAGEVSGDVPNVGVVRALMIIFALHIVAIGGIYFHNRYFEKAGHQTGASVAEKVDPVSEPSADSKTNAPSFSSGGTAYVVVKGDDYAKIAEQYGIDEQELRLANWNVQLRPGRILRIPATPETADESLAENDTELPSLPPVVAPGETAAPVLVKPKAPRAQIVSMPSSKSTAYVVKPGDSVWRISQKFKVSQDALMKANGISNPRKLRVGMKLKIP